MLLCADDINKFSFVLYQTSRQYNAQLWIFNAIVYNEICTCTMFYFSSIDFSGREFKPYNISDNIIIYIAKPLNKAAGIIINISRF